MANYYGVFRSNRFRVRDPKAFLAWADTIYALELHHEADGRYLLLQSEWSDGAGLPSTREVGDDDEDLDFITELAGHVAPGAVAVVIEAGSEKLRYLTGLAWAIRGGDRPEDADVERIGLDDIYEIAADAWSIDIASIDQATY